MAYDPNGFAYRFLRSDQYDFDFAQSFERSDVCKEINIVIFMYLISFGI